MEIDIDTGQWIDWLLLKGLGDKTIKEYSRYLIDFKPVVLTQRYFISYLTKHRNGVSRACMQNLLLYIKTSDLFSDEVKERAKEIDIPKVTGRKKKLIQDCITEEQTFQIGKGMCTERSKLMLLLSFYGGLRVSELCGEYAIKPYDFNWDAWVREPNNIGILKIKGKGNKQRYVYVPQVIMARLYQYINNVVSKLQTPSDKLFTIGPRRWSILLASGAKKTIGKSIHPHTLRHSNNMWLKSQGWEPVERQKYQGHDDIRTTTHYDHTDHADLKAKFQGTMEASKRYSGIQD